MKITFPFKVTKQGVSVTIGTVEKDGRQLFRVLYRDQGKRKQAWRSTFEDAKRAANDAIDATLTGDASALKLNAADRHAYLRAVEILAPLNITLDHAARDYADIRIMLAGKATPAEACSDWLKRNAVELPRVAVAVAVAEFKVQIAAEGKSKTRQSHVGAALDRFATSPAFLCDVQTITPKMVADHLTALPFRERTKRNDRDTIGFFNRWLILRGYLAKGTDWLDGVQNYKARKQGEISTYTAVEMRRLIAAADEEILPLILIGGFAGLRTSEIERLDWQDIDLEDGFIEVKSVEGKKSDERRRIVPIKDNLKKFLEPLAKKVGKVIPLANTAKHLLKTAAETGDEAKEIKPLEWKHNALRHTYISARVAESGDVPRVADEAGNSPQVIRSNYLKRIRPAMAAEWFAIAPSQPANIVPMKQKAA